MALNLIVLTEFTMLIGDFLSEFILFTFHLLSIYQGFTFGEAF
ncbi:hypothetical protein [Lactococcus protaetiae]|nr:hypothetical protein [Lactococcus protaetiae]